MVAVGWLLSLWVDGSHQFWFVPPSSVGTQVWGEESRAETQQLTSSLLSWQCPSKSCPQAWTTNAGSCAATGSC